MPSTRSSSKSKSEPLTTTTSDGFCQLFKAVSETQILMNKLLDSVTSLVTRVDHLAASMNEVILSTKKNAKDISSLKNTGSQSTYASVASKNISPPPPSTYSTFLALQAMEERKLHKKDDNIVMVGASETPGEDIKTQVLHVVSRAGIDPDCISDVFRNGPEGSKAGRIVKVKLSQPTSELKRKVKFILGTSSLCSFARDDLCRLQLQEDRTLRQWCYERNRELGERRFKVVDLKVVQNKRPQVLGGAEDNISEVRSFRDDQ